VGWQPSLENLRTLSGPGWIPVVVDEAGRGVLVMNAKSGVYVLADPDFLDTAGLKTLAGARAEGREAYPPGGVQGHIPDDPHNPPPLALICSPGTAPPGRFPTADLSAGAHNAGHPSHSSGRFLGLGC